MHAFSEITIDTPYFKIAAIESGKENKKKLLLLHGWLDNAASFLPLLPSLKDFHCVAIDIIGHGLSEHRPKASVYHFLDAVPHVLEVLEVLGWNEFYLLGHSMGGAIATLVAGTIPDRIQKLVLIEAIGPFSREAEQVPSSLLKHCEEAAQLRTKRTPIYPDKELAVKARLQAGDLNESSVRLLVERGLKQVSGGWTWRTDPRLRLESPLRLSEAHVLAFLKRISCPTLLVIGDKGLRVLEPPKVETRKNAIKKLETLTFPGGHHVHMELPHEIGSAIHTFLLK